MRSHVRTHAHTLAQTYTATHTHTRSRTHTHARTHARTHTHSRTHTHTHTKSFLRETLCCFIHITLHCTHANVYVTERQKLCNFTQITSHMVFLQEPAYKKPATLTFKMNAKNNCDIPERGHSKESVTRHSPSHLGMDLTGRWIVTMGIVTMLVSELQLLIGNQLVLGPGCSTAISWCWGPAAARQSIGVRARLQHGNQLVLGPSCSTAISWCWSPAAARQSTGVGARLQHGNQLVLGPGCSTAISWCWGRGRPWFTMPTTMLLLMTAFM